MKCAVIRRGEAPPELRSDSGSAVTSLIMLPIAIAVFMMAVNVGLVYYGRHVATSAAHEGLAAAQVFGATAGDGQNAANDILALSGAFESPPRVHVIKGPTETMVTVQAEVRTPLIGIPNMMTIRIVGPSENFYDEVSRG